MHHPTQPSLRRLSLSLRVRQVPTPPCTHFQNSVLRLPQPADPKTQRSEEDRSTYLSDPAA